MSIDVWNKVKWTKEACDLLPDPRSGAAITRLTGSMMMSNNNYYGGSCSADGKRVLGIRFLDYMLSPTIAILALDLETKWTAVLDPNNTISILLHAPFTGLFYYVNDRKELCRVSLDTFDKEVLMSMEGLPPVYDILRGITRDQRYLLYHTLVTISGGLSLAIVRLDLRERVSELIYENPGIHGFSYLPGLNALAVGHRTLADGSTPPLGAWKDRAGNGYRSDLLDLDGNLLRSLGTPPGYGVNFPGSGAVVSNYACDMVNFRHKPERMNGNMAVFASLEYANPRMIKAPEHLFHHIAGSRCERYVVTEAFQPEKGPFGPTSIVVVNIETGKHRTLVTDCGVLGGGGGNCLRQPTPYLTSDNRHVIYNADPDGIPNVYAARIPDGFMESLA